MRVRKLVWLLLPLAANCNGKLESIPIPDSGLALGDAGSGVPKARLCADDVFGDGGQLVAYPPQSAPAAMQLQADGKIVSTDGLSATRYESDGTLDTSFGTNGVVTFQTNWEPGQAGIAIANGKIALSHGTVLRQLESNGALDATFGTSGVADAPPLGQFSISDLAALSDGSIIAVGMANGGITGSDFLLLKYTATGHLDATFGSGGVVEQDLANGSLEGLDRVVVRSDGKIVVAGYGNFIADAGPPFGKFLLARYDANGAIDSSFGTNGLVKSLDVNMFYTPSTWGTVTIGLALAPGDAVVAAFDVFEGDAGQPPTIARFDANGALDSTFGSGGYVSPPTLMGLVVDSKGGVLAATAVPVDGGTANQLVVTRYDSTGALDTSYGSSGSAYATFADQTQVRPSAQRITSTGAVLVGGTGIPIAIDGGSAADYARFSCP